MVGTRDTNAFLKDQLGNYGNHLTVVIECRECGKAYYVEDVRTTDYGSGLVIAVMTGDVHAE